MNGPLMIETDVYCVLVCFLQNYDHGPFSYAFLYFVDYTLLYVD